MGTPSDLAFHGGAFWERCDPTFRTRSGGVIAADVLDAWFSAPKGLLTEFIEELPRWIATSPPTHATGLEQRIAEARSVPNDSVLAGNGSSSLIHLVLRNLLTPGDTIALIEPTYAEYAFVSAELLGARCKTFPLSRENAFQFDEEGWLEWLSLIRPRVAVLVNPNNPTGTLFDVARVAHRLPAGTHLLVDEAYLEYTGASSVEALASRLPQLTVVKSLSKVFGLSGLRAGYLVGHPKWVQLLRSQVPPWSISLPAQWFGCRVWEHLEHYRGCWEATDVLRVGFERDLCRLPGTVMAAAANWVLWDHQLPHPTEAMLSSLRTRGVYLRHAARTAPSLPDRAIRIAVRPPVEQAVILRSLSKLAALPVG